MVYYIVGMSALCLVALVWWMLRKDWSKEVPPAPAPSPVRKKRAKRANAKKPIVESAPPGHCQWCNKTLRRTRVNGRRRRSDRKYCSPSCTQKAFQLRKKAGLVKPRTR